MAALLSAFYVVAIYEIHVSTDGAILAWMIKVVTFLFPRLMATLRWLLMLSLEVVGFVMVHGAGYLVIPTLLLLARIGMHLFINLFCTSTTPVFSPYIKTGEEKEKENKTSAGGFFSLWYMGELKPLPAILLGLGLYLTGSIVHFVVSKIEAWKMAMVNSNKNEQGNNIQETVVTLPTDNTNNDTTTTMGMALKARRLSFGTRFLLLFTPKTATPTSRGALIVLRKGVASMLRHARLSSALIHERPTATASDTTQDENRIRSKSDLGAWARRAARAVSVSVGVRRASQWVAKEGEAAMVAVGC